VFPTAGAIVPDGTPFLGEISLIAGTVAPAGWDFADGQLLSIAVNPALFDLLGTSFGGNGTFDFALPNLEDRVAVGTGDGVTLGEMFGADSETLNFAQLPPGYPATLPVTANVPEPTAITILLMGLTGLAYRRRHRPVCTSTNHWSTNHWITRSAMHYRSATKPVANDNPTQVRKPGRNATGRP
jgi:microcystin-dependent protein